MAEAVEPRKSTRLVNKFSRGYQMLTTSLYKQSQLVFITSYYKFIIMVMFILWWW